MIQLRHIRGQSDRFEQSLQAFGELSVNSSEPLRNRAAQIMPMATASPCSNLP